MGIIGKIRGWRSRPIAKYHVEPRDVQMRIMRSHIAAMSGEISNIRTMLEIEFSKAAERARILDSLAAGSSRAGLPGDGSARRGREEE